MKKALTIILTALLVLSVFVGCSGDAEDLFGKTITFSGNGSTGGTMAEMKVKKGEEVTLPANAFERTDYVFIGWNTQADGKGTGYADRAKAKFEENTTLYAQWTEELTITFNANDGSETPATKTQKVGKGVATALDSNTFELSGFTFTKWNTKKGGSGTDYADGSVKTFESALELYAQWSANTDTPYVVNHYTKDLTGDKYTLSSTDNNTETTGVILTLADLKKTIEGFTYSEGFAGTETKGTTKPSSGAVTEAEVLGEGNLVIDLYYSRDSHTVALTKGTESDHISAITGADTYAYGASVSVEATIDSGYKFANWIVTGETTEVSTANPYVFTMGASDVAYTANATPISYTVVFDKNNESATGTMANQSFKYDTAQNLTANAYSWASHSFTGWNTSSDGKGTSYADGASVSNLTTTDGATVTLYAQWSEGATVTFHKNDGVTPESTTTQLIQFNTETALTDNTFSRDTYIFLGWNTAEDGTGTSYSDKQKVTLTANLDLYAQWAIDLATTTLSKTSWTTGNVYSMSADVSFSNTDNITVEGSVTLILPKDKTLTASAGITVDSGNSLTINGEGTLTANGSFGAAGIGGGEGGDGGTIIINGGAVTATGGSYAAGIGGGQGGDGGTIIINGGTVTATGDSSAAGIGGGQVGDGGTVTITGGSVTSNGGSGAAGIGAGDGGSSHGTLTIADGVLMMVSTNNTDWSVYDGSTRTQYMKVPEPTVLTSSMTSWEGGNVYTLGDEDVTTIDNRITVTGSVGLILPDGRKLTASKGITVSTGNSLTISGTGTLVANASGQNYKAGIGGDGDNKDCGVVTINGGTVTATGGAQAAGIGGGNDGGNGGTVTISGGTVEATGGFGAAGIGGAYGEISAGKGGKVTITGGTVTATGKGGAAGIGGGKGEYYYGGEGADVEISGGSVTATGGGSNGLGIGGGYGGEYDRGNNKTLTLTGVTMEVSTDNTSWTDYNGTRKLYMRTK